MEKVTTKKRLRIVKQYLSGLSYDDIAAKSGVSKGSVANIVGELKAGKFPEAADAAEHIEQLRELSLELERANLTPGQCALGLMALARINECGLDPADIDRWSPILKSVGNEDEVREFVGLVCGIQEVQKRTGLSLDALDNRVRDLEKKAAELKPVSGKLADCQKQLGELTRQRKELVSEIAGLEQKSKRLTPRVGELEQEAQTLSDRIVDMEPKAKKAEATLAAFSKEMKRLQNIGLTFEALGELSEGLTAMAQRHALKPADLRGRLSRELESLDRALGLEALVKSKQQELAEQERLVAKARQELETTKAAVGSVKQEKANLEASVKETRESVSGEIANQLTQELQNGVDKAIAEVRRLRDKSLEVGKEVGRFQAILEAHAWLKGLLALVRGEPGVDAKQVKVIALLVVQGINGWLKAQDKSSLKFASLSNTTDILTRQLEQWKV